MNKASYQIERRGSDLIGVFIEENMTMLALVPYGAHADEQALLLIFFEGAILA